MFGYTEKKLARDIARISKRLDPGLEPTYEAASRTVQLHRVAEPEAQPYRVFLGNIFLKVKDMGRRQRRETLESMMVEALTPKERSPDEMLAALALRVRTPFELNLREKMLALRSLTTIETVTCPAGELSLELVADSEETVSSVSATALAETNTSTEEGFALARATLARATGYEQWSEHAPGLWLSTYEDDYDFARLIAAGDQARLPFDGQPVVFAPSHSVCLVTNRLDEATLTAMVDLGDELSATHRPLSQLLWTVSDEQGFHAWSPPPGNDGAGVAARQRAREALTQYSEQKEYLEALLESRQEDSFVASYRALERGDAIESIVAYTLRLPSYLPRATLVALVDPDADEDQTVLGTVPWADFEATLAPDRLRRLDDLVPDVYQLTEAPSPEQEKKLRTLVTPME